MFNNHFSSNLICLCCLDHYLCNGNAKIKPNCQHLLDHRESKGIPEKRSASLTMLKPLTVWITTNLKRWEYQTTTPVS